MITGKPERSITSARTVQFVVQHRWSADDGGWPEARPHKTAEAAVREMDQHAYAYLPGNIRVVRKTITTTVRVEVAEVLREELPEEQVA